jgi:hypothetical protein
MATQALCQEAAADSFSVYLFYGWSFVSFYRRRRLRKLMVLRCGCCFRCLRPLQRGDSDGAQLGKLGM